MLDEIIIKGLIGEDDYYRIFNGLPSEFFKMKSTTQEGLWAAVRSKIEEGTKDIQELIIYARLWIKLYPIVKASTHKAILNF